MIPFFCGQKQSLCKPVKEERSLSTYGLVEELGNCSGSAKGMT